MYLITMTEETKKVLVNRLKSFAWRLGSYIFVALLAFISDNLGLFNLNPATQTIVALILGEVTKALNTR